MAKAKCGAKGKATDYGLSTVSHNTDHSWQFPFLAMDQAMVGVVTLLKYSVMRHVYDVTPTQICEIRIRCKTILYSVQPSPLSAQAVCLLV